MTVANASTRSAILLAVIFALNSGPARALPPPPPGTPAYPPTVPASVKKKGFYVYDFCNSVGSNAELRRPDDAYAWRCENGVGISPNLVCQSQIGPEWAAGLGSRIDPESWYCYNRTQLRGLQAKKIGRRLAAYMIQNLPPESYASLYASKPGDPILAEAAKAITEHADDPPPAPDAPDFSSPDGYGAMMIELWHYNNPGEAGVLHLPPSPGERITTTIMERLSGRQSWGSALRRNFPEFYHQKAAPPPPPKPAPSSSPVTASSTSGQQESEGPGGREDPNDRIGVHDEKSMEASTKETREYGGKSFGEQLREAVEKNEKESPK